MKTLKVWNGKYDFVHKHGDPFWANHTSAPRTAAACVAAYSRADAIRVIVEYLGYKPRGMNAELRDYWSECWGHNMEGIKPERGLWVSRDGREIPIRVV
jgi:hypothetical protein